MLQGLPVSQLNTEPRSFVGNSIVDSIHGSIFREYLLFGRSLLQLHGMRSHLLSSLVKETPYNILPYVLALTSRFCGCFFGNDVSATLTLNNSIIQCNKIIKSCFLCIAWKVIHIYAIKNIGKISIADDL